MMHIPDDGFTMRSPNDFQFPQQTTTYHEKYPTVSNKYGFDNTNHLHGDDNDLILSNGDDAND